jgi:hypothetical protein
VYGRHVDFEKDHRFATLSFNEPDNQRAFKPDTDNGRAEKPPADVAVSSYTDMESYRAARDRARGR